MTWTRLSARTGDTIPTINELCAQWHCSTGTARSALTVLRAEGLITHGRGKAATVREAPRRIKLPQAFGQQQKDAVLLPDDERSVSGAIELTEGIKIADTAASYRYSTVPADVKLAEEFHLPAGTPLLRREYEMRDPKSGSRLSYSISYIPKFLIESNPKLLDEKNEPWPGGHQHQLYTVGIELDRIIRSVIAVEPSPGSAQKWDMEPGVPMLVVHSMSIDTRNRVVEISDATYPADRSELEFTEKLDRWPSDQIPERANGRK
jgi:GntR family transcriptional regulator